MSCPTVSLPEGVTEHVGQVLHSEFQIIGRVDGAIELHQLGRS